MSVNTTDIPAGQLTGRLTLGKTVEAVTDRALVLRAKFFLTELGGRKVVAGFATFTGDYVREDLRHLLTEDPAAVERDFYKMAESLRVGS